jgi:integrase/recombinase XerD
LFTRYFGDIPLSQISFQRLEEYFSETYKRTPQGARTYFIIIRSAFNKAISWGYLDENMASYVKLPKIQKKIPKFVTKDELELILSKETNTDYRDIYEFAFHTGMRRAEIINLKWNDVNLSNNEIIVRNSKSFSTKNKRDRIIPMNTTVQKILNNRLPKIRNINNNDFVFTKVKGVKYLGATITSNFKRAILRSDVDNELHFHHLRHSFASNLVMRGVPILGVSNLLGHQDISTTQIYSHLRKEELVKAVNCLDE